MVEKNNMKQVISVQGDEITMDGYSLNKIANMSLLSAHDFLNILQSYILHRKTPLGYKVVIQKSEGITFTPSNKMSTVNIGKVLVDKRHCNAMKTLIFDLAYTKCSSKMIDTSLDIGPQVLTNNLDLYCCTYIAPNGEFNQMISSIPIDKEEFLTAKKKLKIR